ncbi:Green-light absorbing proteorhodopsin precursor [Mycobacterium bohemicum DSM 44277]|uniref:Green-light absorbing proteorhodopsin n=1 Tax=Mycobacterium bohemicum DSM 44277 TaxID=1236609 RepID=A0A0U0W5Q5_MYCBE|nr:bacteriorhodopsin-like [Mycobacterium bohemicum]MCV6968427.1 bacteriorhodopsin [Mycobacterium bohemicum]CPR08493.1 Green-light absorbing proteorhodopsin precursor [Mycobacterium bohemicum DSM 44277]
MIPNELTPSQYDTVYNLFSFSIAAQLFTAIFLLAAQGRVLARYRQAVVISAIVCGIAAYHYFRIFDSFRQAFVTTARGGRGTYVQAAGESFNEGYRYVDWLLTVPLLLTELVVVLALARKLQSSLLRRLIPASAVMIGLGYPGEISGDNAVRNIFGLLSTIPFLYILYVLFVELTRSLDRQPAAVRSTVSGIRFLLLATWGVYPLAYIIPLYASHAGAAAWVAKQGGYSVADILAKCLYGLLIYKIARLKSAADDPGFAAEEGAHADVPAGSHNGVGNGSGKPAKVLAGPGHDGTPAATA